jgi:hypothetical protein
MNVRIAVALGGLVAGLALLSVVSAATISVKQASVDDQQGACLEGGGAITSAHFVINQITPASNAPAFITVTWTNGDTEDVPLDRVTGKVAHYTVAGTATHTAIADATADIYDEWSGQFNLSSVECGPGPEPPLDACTPFEDRIIIVFNARLGDPTQAAGVTLESDPVAVDIAAGTYLVTLQSFDEHSAHGGQGQEQEQWFARFTAGGTVDSGVISDLPDDQDVINEQVGTIEFTSTATQVVARHALAGGTFTTPESIEAVCVALDPQ